ncbi:MAG: GNAT family N-acetyltransferase [Candidatus Latescibacteria bacterium]|nr:GNAT family N-acetyltransferase [Candidatus Latescibacterota bacterium]
MSSSVLPPHPSLEQLKKQAKSLFKAFQAADRKVAFRLKQSLSRLSGLSDQEIFHAKISLKDAQYIIAREHGFADWTALKRHVDEIKGQKRLAGTADVVFRPPIEDDLEAIQAGWDRAVPHDPLATNWAQTSRDLVFLSEEEGLSRVATLNGTIIGFVSATKGTLRAIYVVGPYRRQGVGDALLAEIIEFAQKKGWNQLSVATFHHWVGTMPGIDIRYENTVRFLEHRGFERGQLIPDMEADFQDIETASRQRPLQRVCTVSEYHPDEIEEMKAFDERRETGWPDWVWVNRIAKYPQTDHRVYLVARVEGQLVGCVEAQISHGVAEINYLSVESAYRHQGISSALLREIASVCQHRGAKSMFAAMVSHKFYEVNGWRVQREFVKMTNLLRR